jgi:hypothetical protein
VDGLAISSQSPFSVVGENFPIANQGQSWIPSPGIVSMGYWREALFIVSATHGEIPCAAAKGW